MHYSPSRVAGDREGRLLTDRGRAFPAPRVHLTRLGGMRVPDLGMGRTRLSCLHFHALEKEMATHSSQGRGSLVGCRLWGRTESDTTEAT